MPERGFAGVEVVGLKEFRKALKTVDAAMPKELSKATKKAGDIIAADARSRVPVRTGRARGAIRATSSGDKTYIVGGKASSPYYGWLDFGTRRPIRGRPRRVGPWRNSGTGPTKGRFIYVAINAKFGEFVDQVQRALDTARRKAGL